MRRNNENIVSFGTDVVVNRLQFSQIGNGDVDNSIWWACNFTNVLMVQNVKNTPALN